LKKPIRHLAADDPLDAVDRNKMRHMLDVAAGHRGEQRARQVMRRPDAA
jgi:hypothetical protein